MSKNWIELGNGEGNVGYFAEDRDSVYCVHGTYIGYPGGPDYLCGLCEDGCFTVRSGVKWAFLFADSFQAYKPILECYSPVVLASRISVLEELGISYEISQEIYHYWGR